ncbi:MAG: WG repeat-containing protein [candidate division WOR-3 bacterium]
MFNNKENIRLIIFVALYIISFLPEISLANENEILYPIRKQFEKEALLVWKQGFMNKQGQVVIEPTFSKVNYFKDGVALVGEQGDWGYIDKKGKIIIEIQYIWATDFSEDLAQVLIRSKENGKMVLQTTFWPP